jgi:hypothetical protein
MKQYMKDKILKFLEANELCKLSNNRISDIITIYLHMDDSPNVVPYRGGVQFEFDLLENNQHPL